MNRRVSPLLNKLEEARIAKNCSLDEIGTLRKDKGYVQFADAPTTDDVLALYPFYKIGTTTDRYLLRDSGGKLYQATFGSPDTWTQKATGLNSSAIPSWITYKNLAMRWNGTDNPKKWDGTTLADVGGSPPNGSIATLYKDRVYVAGAGPNYSTVRYSATGNVENWPVFNNFDVNNNDGDRIIAIEPAFDSLLIFKEFSLWEFQVDPKNNPSVLRYITLEIGTTARRSIVNIGGILYFFNRKGIYQLASRYPELISLKVQDFIDAITDPYAVIGYKDGNKYCLSIGDVTVDGRSYPKCVLVYDTLQDTWKVRTLAHTIKATAEFIGSDNVSRVYLGSTAGKTFRWAEGYSHAGTPIEVEYETGTIELGDPKREKGLNSIILRTSNRPKSSPTIHYSLDGSEFNELGHADSTIWEPPIRGRGRDIRFRIHEVSEKEMREIYKLSLYVDETIGGEKTKKR